MWSPSGAVGCGKLNNTCSPVSFHQCLHFVSANMTLRPALATHSLVLQWVRAMVLLEALYTQVPIRTLLSSPGFLFFSSGASFSKLKLVEGASINRMNPFL